MDFSNILSIITTIITVLTVGVGIGTFKQKITTLEQKVDKHNNVIERVFRIETNIDHVDIGVLKANQDHMIQDIAQIKEDIRCQKKK